YFSSRRRHTISKRDWSSDVCSSDLHISAQSFNVWIHVTRACTSGSCKQAVVHSSQALMHLRHASIHLSIAVGDVDNTPIRYSPRSEERRVGKECCSRVLTGRDNVK